MTDREGPASIAAPGVSIPAATSPAPTASAASTQTSGGAIANGLTDAAAPQDAATNHTAQPAAPPEDDAEARLARLFLEDLAVTALLRQGRALKPNEMAGADGFAPSRAALREALQDSRRVTPRERDWDLTLRRTWTARPRDERSRQPLEGTLETLLLEIGKPLPLPVVVRELSLMRGVLPEAVRDAAANILRTARSIIEVAPGAWLHRSFTLDAGAPREELIIRENNLEADPDWRALQSREFAPPADDSSANAASSGAASANAALAARAAAILRAAGRPLSQKALGFFLWKQNPAAFDARALATVMADRSAFYSFVGGLVTTQAQTAQWRAATEAWLRGLQNAGADALDVAALLRQRLPAESLVAPSPADLEELKKATRAGRGQPLSVAMALVDLLEIEPDDPAFVPMLQGFNDALRRNSAEWLPAGSGRFLLREMVPATVSEVPEVLRPVHVSIRNNETHEPFDIEMSDDGLEGDCTEFIHAPQWEDIGEEVEVKLARRVEGEAAATARSVVTYPHYQAGTLKLRRVDEEFFPLEGALSRLAVRAQDEEGSEELGAWASRDSGLISGLGDWFKPRLPHSGGVLEWSRNAGGGLLLAVGAPDKLTFVDAERVAELEELQERSAYLSLFDLLQSVMDGHPQGAELPALWAEVNVVRRTTKRLVCSVLCAYHCFYFKQRGPKQILWRFDEGKLDQGFKRNKRKYVRR